MPVVGGGIVGGNNGGEDSLENVAWELNGNEDIDPLQHFLGTVGNKPLIIKTNDTERARVTENGRIGIGEDRPQSHVHIKSYSGYEGSGLQIETFAATFDDTNLNNIYSYIVPINKVCLITVTFIGREGTQERCGFRRTLVVYREGGIVQVLKNWQSDFTMKSNKNFDVSYNVVMDTVHFKVKNANPNETNWSGHIEIEAIG